MIQENIAIGRAGVKAKVRESSKKFIYETLELMQDSWNNLMQDLLCGHFYFAPLCFSEGLLLANYIFSGVLVAVTLDSYQQTSVRELAMEKPRMREQRRNRAKKNQGPVWTQVASSALLLLLLVTVANGEVDTGSAHSEGPSLSHHTLDRRLNTNGEPNAFRF